MIEVMKQIHNLYDIHKVPKGEIPEGYTIQGEVDDGVYVMKILNNDEKAQLQALKSQIKGGLV